MHRNYIGVDELFNTMKESADYLGAAYPPYNIKKIDENKYTIEIAVAGFGKQDIEITFEDSKLKVTGEFKDSSPEDSFIWKGISERPFVRSFVLADNVEIKGADLINGMLKIWLEQMIPESKKPRKIDIGAEKTSNVGPQLLREDDL
jgi:molecular chaperone IbpA